MEVKNWGVMFRGRVLGFFVFVVLLFVVVTARQAWLQCVSTEFYRREAKDTQMNIKAGVGESVGVRGDILDRHYQTLATSAERRSINCHPWRIKNPERVAHLLAPVIKMEESKLFAILSSDDSFVILQYKAPNEMCDAVERMRNRYCREAEEAKKGSEVDDSGKISLGSDFESGIEIVRESSGQRYYPKGRLASHVLGVVGDQENGLEGIEAAFDKELSPSREKIDAPVDAYGNTIPDVPVLGQITEKKQSVINGSNVVLTIDERVQYIVERELEKAVKSFKAKGGSIVVMDAHSADILAMATYPDFAPAEYDKFSLEVRRNRAITDFYEPGSIFKVLLAGVALSNGYTAKSMFYCPGQLYVDGWPINNADDGLYSKGSETIADIMAYSFNTGTASCALELGREKVGKGLESFGIGKATGLEFVGESEGMLADWHDWPKSRLVTISFGQGVAVTPVQLASALQAVANDGVRLRPHLVKEIVSADGKSRTKTKPEVLGKPLSKEGAKDMREILAGVVSYGTGKRARVPGYRVGGKTGTAQVPGRGGYAEGKYVAGFLGLAPVDKPEIVVVIKIEEPWPVYYGGLVAGPTFKNVTSKILPVLNVAPTPGYKQVDPATGL